MYRSSMSTTRSARATGAVFLFASIGLGVILLSLFWNQLLRSSESYEVVPATVLNIIPSRVTAFPRHYTGNTIYYGFEVAGIRYEGNFFRRTYGKPENQIGQAINVIYPHSDPGKSSLYVPSTMNYYVFAFMVVVMLLFACIGITMLVTGRDFLHEWKQGLHSWQ